jgi:hypothetical protein
LWRQADLNVKRCGSGSEDDAPVKERLVCEQLGREMHFARPKLLLAGGQCLQAALGRHLIAGKVHDIRSK